MVSAKMPCLGPSLRIECCDLDCLYGPPLKKEFQYYLTGVPNHEKRMAWF